MKPIPPWLDVHPEVAAALRHGRPVVALESSLIAQGLPWPHNLKAARMAEGAVRGQTAVPATIAVIQGKPTVGLSDFALEDLAKPGNLVLKLSRRDLAAAIVRGRTGGTTVAATMYLAHCAGIRVFATGGIGGVHRPAFSPLPSGGEGLGVRGQVLQSANPSPPAPLPQGERGERMPAPLSQGERGERMPAPLSQGERGERMPAPLSQGERGERMPAPLSQGERGERMPAPLSQGERGDLVSPSPLAGEGRGEGADEWDISADLHELSQTPVVVVCSGAKSILDIPRTLEMLESLSVPVIGYGTDDFPGFYIRSSGQPVPLRVDRVAEAADILAVHWHMDGGGVVLAQPVPAEVAIPADEFAAALATAETLAAEQQVHGPRRTPFLLQQLGVLTKEKTLRANISLVVANARLAARLATELANKGYQ